MNITRIVYFFEKYSFIIIILFTIGIFTPHLTPKMGLMDNDSFSVTKSLSGGNFVKQLLWLSLFVFLSWRSFQQKIYTHIKWGMLCTLLFMVGGLALISALWSLYPLLTIKRALFQVILCFCVVTSFFFAKNHNSLEVSLVWGACLIIGMTLVSIVLGVGFSGGSLAGFTKGKNLLGQSLLVYTALMYLQIKLFSQHLRHTRKLIVVLTILLIFTMSKTSIILLFLFFILGHTNLFLTKLVNSTAFISLIMIFIFVPTFSYFLGDYIHAGLYLDPSAITGRGIIWDTLYFDLDFFSKLSLGYGYGVYFGNGTIPYFFDDDWSFLKHIASAHSGYIDILLQYGLFFSSIIIFFIYRLSSGIKNNWLCAAFIIPIIYNFTESTFLRDQTMMWLFTIILFCYLTSLKEQYLQPNVREL